MENKKTAFIKKPFADHPKSSIGKNSPILPTILFVK